MVKYRQVEHQRCLVVTDAHVAVVAVRGHLSEPENGHLRIGLRAEGFGFKARHVDQRNIFLWRWLGSFCRRRIGGGRQRAALSQAQYSQSQYKEESGWFQGHS